MAHNPKTFKQAGYTYVENLGDGQHLLKDEDGEREIFGCNKGHAGWCLIYKNTNLEFCNSLKN